MWDENRQAKKRKVAFVTHPNSCMSVKTKGDVTGNDGGWEGDKQKKKNITKQNKIENTANDKELSGITQRRPPGESGYKVEVW